MIQGRIAFHLARMNDRFHPNAKRDPDRATMPLTALGFRAHSGWAMAVPVTGSTRSPAAIERRRIDLADPNVPGSTQPYHSAEYLDRREAERFVKRCINDTSIRSRDALDAAIRGLEDKGYQVAGAGIVLGSGRPVPDIAAAFASHPSAHAAEGELFRSAIRTACEQRKLPVVGVRERELFPRGASRLGISVNHVRRVVTEMGRPLGPPWRQDEKQAALVGWLALAAGSSETPSRRA